MAVEKMESSSSATCRENIAMRFTLIHPKESVISDVNLREVNTVRILPTSMQRLPTSEPDKAMEVLKSDLCNSEVCKDALI